MNQTLATPTRLSFLSMWLHKHSQLVREDNADRHDMLNYAWHAQLICRAMEMNDDEIKNTIGSVAHRHAAEYERAMKAGR